MLSVQSLRKALSDERLEAHRVPGDRDELEAVCRYLWNLALCAAIQPALHFLEVTLRNHIFDASRSVLDESRLRFDKVPCWLDASPSLLEAKERRAAFPL